MEDGADYACGEALCWKCVMELAQWPFCQHGKVTWSSHCKITLQLGIVHPSREHRTSPLAT